MEECGQNVQSLRLPILCRFGNILFTSLCLYLQIVNMPRDPLIGLVGKPSSGKSTTLNRYACPALPCMYRN